MTLDVTIITGMSGAGRSAAADVLEDLGFFVIDNLPPALVTKVAELGRGTEGPQQFGLVIDVRSGEFVDDLVAALAEPARDGREHAGPVPRRRRRRARAPVRGEPPQAPARRPTSACPEGIANERQLLEDLKGRADIVLDTSELNVHELRDRLRELFDADHEAGALQTSIVSFGYKHGLPDRRRPRVRLPLPSQPALGRRAAPRSPAPTRSVRDYVLAQPETGPFLEELRAAVRVAAPRVRARRASRTCRSGSAAPAVVIAAS